MAISGIEQFPILLQTFAGTIGALIPPSILLIIYGTMAQVSIIQLFIYGAIMGLMTTVAYVAVVLIRVWLRPELAPHFEPEESQPRLALVLDTWPVVLLVFGVFGGLFGGLFTPTEAGAVGSVLAIVIGAAKRTLTLRAVGESLLEAAMTTSTILIITVGAAFFMKLMVFAGISGAVQAAVDALGGYPVAVMLIMALIYLLLGMFLEPIGAMLITLPIFLPLARDLGYDAVWFGVIVAKLLEVGMITPPVGLNVFVIKNVVGPSVELQTVFKGILYFFVADLLLILINVAYPDLLQNLSNLW